MDFKEIQPIVSGNHRRVADDYARTTLEAARALLAQVNDLCDELRDDISCQNYHKVSCRFPAFLQLQAAIEDYNDKAIRLNEDAYIYRFSEQMEKRKKIKEANHEENHNHH